jgi:anion-transporting  ArsA/GET3 family ATPase
MPRVKAALDIRPLQFVVGKGGVGKSAVTAALAIAHCRAGRRVLAVELGRREGLSRFLLPGIETGGLPREVRDGLWLCRVQGDDALSEYLGMILPGRALLDLVFSSRLYRYFVAAAPGLKELMAVGKIGYERQKKRDGGRPLWDIILVDAGASGQSLQYLQMPATAAKTFRTGLVHRESLKISTLLADAATSVIHVVAIPEDMPLAEASEIVARLRSELALPVGTLFMNRVRAAAPTGCDAAVDRLEAVPYEDTDHLVARSVAGTARRSLAWIDLQEDKLQRFERSVGLETFRLPLLEGSGFGATEIELLASRLVGRSSEARR